MRWVAGLAAVVVVLLPAEAHLSGSSTVEATSKFFRVEVQSVSARFRSTDDETAWHVEWKRKNQAVVEGLKVAIEGKLPGAMRDGKWPLVEFKADYQEVLHDLAEEDDSKSVLASGKPFRYRFRLRSADVIVCFAKLPPPKLREAMREALAAMLPKP